VDYCEWRIIILEVSNSMFHTKWYLFVIRIGLE
jgi:hypothetical protein